MGRFWTLSSSSSIWDQGLVACPPPLPPPPTPTTTVKTQGGGWWGVFFVLYYLFCQFLSKKSIYSPTFDIFLCYLSICFNKNHTEICFQKVEFWQNFKKYPKISKNFRKFQKKFKKYHQIRLKRRFLTIFNPPPPRPRRLKKPPPTPQKKPPPETGAHTPHPPVLRLGSVGGTRPTPGHQISHQGIKSGS